MTKQITPRYVTITVARVEYVDGELIINTSQAVGSPWDAACIQASWEDGEESSKLGVFVSDQWRGMSAAADKARRVMANRQGRA